MIFIFYLVLLVCNFILFMLNLLFYNRNIKIIKRLYIYITIPVLIYSVVCFIYLIVKGEQLCLDLSYRVIMFVLFGLVIFSNINKIYVIITLSSPIENDISAILTIALGVLIAAISLSLIAIKYVKNNNETKEIQVEQFQIEEIDFKQVLNGGEIKFKVIDENQEESELSLWSFNVEEISDTKDEKYIKKYMQKNIKKKFFNNTTIEENCTYTVYTPDIEEYILLLEHCNQ